MSSKAFDLYVKKNIFTLFLCVMFTLTGYIAFDSISSNSLSSLSRKLAGHKERFAELGNSHLELKKNFDELRRRMTIVRQFKHQYSCTSSPMSRSKNLFYFEINNNAFDFSRRVDLLYNAVVEVQSKENVFDFEVTKAFNVNKIGLSYSKHANSNAGDLKISNLCTFLLGYKHG